MALAHHAASKKPALHDVASETVYVSCSSSTTRTPKTFELQTPDLTLTQARYMTHQPAAVAYDPIARPIQDDLDTGERSRYLETTSSLVDAASPFNFARALGEHATAP
jgi:hypothetical protein